MITCSDSLRFPDLFNIFKMKKESTAFINFNFIKLDNLQRVGKTEQILLQHKKI